MQLPEFSEDKTQEVLTAFSKPYTALVVQGPQGSGKGLLIDTLPGSEKFHRLSSAEFFKGNWLGCEPKVVCIEEFSTNVSEKQAVFLKTLIASKESEYRPNKKQPARMVKNPKLIICTTDRSIFGDSRRFEIVEI